MQEATFVLKKILMDIYDSRESTNISDWIIEDITGLSRIDRIMYNHQELTDQQKELFDQYSIQLATGMPVQYVTGYGWFMGQRFRLNEHVLIPRPETEELVLWAMEEIMNHKKEQGPLIILDIGTGSGCIPVVLKKKFPDVEVHSIEISPAALDLARDNALDHHVDIRFHLGNFLEPATWDDLPVMDLVISNPPYIPLRDKDTIARNVLDFEPHLALFVNNTDPFIFYRAIAGFAKIKLNKNGSIFLELDADQSRELKKLMEKYGFSAELKKDLQGRSRMMKLVWA